MLSELGSGGAELRLSLSKSSLCILVVSQSLPDRGDSWDGNAVSVCADPLCCASFLVQFSHLQSIFPPQCHMIPNPHQLSLPAGESSEGRV